MTLAIPVPDTTGTASSPPDRWWDADDLQREATPDRPVLSANDWWGMGFLDGIDACPVPAKKFVRWYCGKGAAYDQFYAGQRYGQQLNIAEALK